MAGFYKGFFFIFCLPLAIILSLPAPYNIFALPLGGVFFLFFFNFFFAAP
jgi:hypothetical protein